MTGLLSYLNLGLRFALFKCRFPNRIPGQVIEIRADPHAVVEELHGQFDLYHSPESPTRGCSPPTYWYPGLIPHHSPPRRCRHPTSQQCPLEEFQTRTCQDDRGFVNCPRSLSSSLESHLKVLATNYCYLPDCTCDYLIVFESTTIIRPRSHCHGARHSLSPCRRCPLCWTPLSAISKASLLFPLFLMIHFGDLDQVDSTSSFFDQASARSSPARHRTPAFRGLPSCDWAWPWPLSPFLFRYCIRREWQHFVVIHDLKHI